MSFKGLILKPLLYTGALLLATQASAASLGYGTFLGEFSGNVNSAADVNTALATTLDLTLGGGWEAGVATGDPVFTVTTYKDGNPSEPIGGTWAYGGGTADMIVAVKYSNYFSLFQYDGVMAGDDGLFSSWGTMTGETMATNRNGKPYAISHIAAYMSDLETPAPVPVPPAILLLGTAVASLFGLRFRRKGAPAATA